jgi:hypothetical protein
MIPHFVRSALFVVAIAAIAGCAVSTEPTPKNDEKASSTSEALGESTCATVHDYLCFPPYGCFHEAYNGPSADGKALKYAANSAMIASSPDGSYTQGSACSNAWITDIYGVTDAPGHERFVYSQPVSLPTTQAACQDVAQGTSVYVHYKGQPWSTWTQLGGTGKVFYQYGTWYSGTGFGSNTCYLQGDQLPGIPTTGIDEVRVASFSFAFFFGIPTSAGMEDWFIQ